MSKQREPKYPLYQQHLERVSRSFVVCIAALNSPLRERVALSYLLCRVLDTVEDTPWPNKLTQKQQFVHFAEWLEKPALPEELVEWKRRFSAAVPVSEQLLLDDFGILLDDFHALPDDVRAIMREPILSMCRGMEYFALRSTRGVKIADMPELNQYCFFVAGVVGEILTGLVGVELLSQEFVRENLERSIHFGLLLQKINILKDQMEDEKADRLFVPNRLEVLASLPEHAEHAMQYLLSIPENLLGFRLFCAWSLFLGLASLPYIIDSAEKGTAVKIPRSEAEILFAHIAAQIEDGPALRLVFTRALESFKVRGLNAADTVAARAATHASSEILHFYHGTLAPAQLENLFGSHANI